MSAGTVPPKLSEFLDLHQGNHSIYKYTQEFNNLAQYGGHHIDTDEKKAELYRKGLTIQLQDRMILSPNLSYDDLASATTDQEGTIRALKLPRRRRGRGPCQDPPEVVLAVLPLSIAWFTRPQFQQQ
jgi:hypothetical protein